MGHGAEFGGREAEHLLEARGGAESFLSIFIQKRSQ